MRKFMRLYRDPDEEGNTGGILPPALVPGNEPTPPVTPATPPPAIPATPPPIPATPPPIPAGQETVPKTKEEWDKLSAEDPQRWIGLTQTRMDQTIRKSRETTEKLRQEQDRIKNLTAELENLKKGDQPPAVPGGDPNKPFSKENLPQSEEQWEQLWLENPNLASDLRNHKFDVDKQTKQNQTVVQQEFAKSRKESAQLLWDRHPDMYVQEVDESGNIRVDGNGKPILKVDPKVGGPMLNLESDKGKLFVKVYTEDPAGYDGSKFGPRLAMNEMELRLQEQGNKEINNAGQAGQTGGQAAAPDHRGTLPGGVTPPVSAKASFSSDSEKVHATKAVEHGIYKDLEEYCQLRDKKETGISEEGRVPKFS